MGETGRVVEGTKPLLLLLLPPLEDPVQDLPRCSRSLVCELPTLGLGLGLGLEDPQKGSHSLVCELPDSFASPAYCPHYWHWQELRNVQMK